MGVTRFVYYHFVLYTKFVKTFHSFHRSHYAPFFIGLGDLIGCDVNADNSELAVQKIFREKVHLLYFHHQLHHLFVQQDESYYRLLHFFKPFFVLDYFA
jgi:hypothetical protein